jgi:arabinogalactan oligomer/maltooligosaccharide transport system permease protein
MAAVDLIIETAPRVRPPKQSGAARRWQWFRVVGWRHLIGAVAIVGCLFPVVYVLSAAFSATSATSQFLPTHWSLNNFRTLFANPQYPYVKWLLNSLYVCLTVSFFSTFLGALGAYAFARMRFTGRRFGLFTVLIVQMFPQLLAVVALFLIMVNVKRVFPAFGLGTLNGLILVYLGGALGANTWLLKGFFDTIPMEIDESARVDGATHAQIYFMIILPLVRPILAVVFLLSFIGTLNDFVISSALLKDNSHWTLAVGLYQFVSNEFGKHWGPFAAGALIAAVPVVVLFQFLQRYIVSGLTQGSVKG